MKLSKFGRLFGSDAGIVQLMDDLGEALTAGDEVIMLGGGNPGRIPAVEALFRERMFALLADGDAFERLIGVYGPPGGSSELTVALSELLRHEYGWDVGPRNIAVTNGSQSASFMLFNLLAGDDGTGGFRKIMLPLTPEYIGYADQGLAEDFFVSRRPQIEHLDDKLFKYHVALDGLELTDDVAALCVSRPTNPTGNVLTDDEIGALVSIAERHDVPLIVDSAYGLPFPHIVFTEATPVWSPNVIICLSLSKLGLPGLRTGIVIASEPIVRALSGVNAIVNLTTGSFGPALAQALISSGDILRVGRDLIAPYYAQRARRAVARLRTALADHDCHIHTPEGAFFLWLWMRGLPITSEALYQRLKARGVLVLPGHHFFPGLPQDWGHKHECIRINYSQDEAAVARGLEIVAEEVRRAYTGGGSQVL